MATATPAPTEVRQPAGDEPADVPLVDDLTDRIATALIRNALIDARRVTITTCGGEVILTGTMRSRAERQETERVVSSAPGVSQVENRITVRP